MCKAPAASPTPLNNVWTPSTPQNTSYYQLCQTLVSTEAHQSDVSHPKKSWGVSGQDRSTSEELRKDACTWPDLDGVLHTLSGREGSVKAPAKPLRVPQGVLNIIPSYIFEGHPAAGQGRHTEM